GSCHLSPARGGAAAAWGNGGGPGMVYAERPAGRAGRGNTTSRCVSGSRFCFGAGGRRGTRGMRPNSESLLPLCPSAKGLLMSLRPHLRSLSVVLGLALVPGVGFWWCLASSPRAAEPSGDQAPAGVKVTVYDPDPQHLWNRLHAALIVRLTDDRGGKETVL